MLSSWDKKAIDREFVARGKGGGSGVLESMLEQESGACPGFFKGGAGLQDPGPRQNLHSSFSFWRSYFLPAPFESSPPFNGSALPLPFFAISPPIFQIFPLPRHSSHFLSRISLFSFLPVFKRYF